MHCSSSQPIISHAITQSSHNVCGFLISLCEAMCEWWCNGSRCLEGTLEIFVPKQCDMWGLSSDCRTFFSSASLKQECIPVGCVPATHWPYAGVCFQEGGVPGPGEYLVWGVPGPGGCLVQGVPGPGGCLLLGRGVVSQHALRQTPPCEQNDRQVQKYYLGNKCKCLKQVFVQSVCMY